MKYCEAVWIFLRFKVYSADSAVFLKSMPFLSILDLVPEPACKAEKITPRISVSNGEKYFHQQPARVEGRFAVMVLQYNTKNYWNFHRLYLVMMVY